MQPSRLEPTLPTRYTDRSITVESSDAEDEASLVAQYRSSGYTVYIGRTVLNLQIGPFRVTVQHRRAAGDGDAAR